MGSSMGSSRETAGGSGVANAALSEPLLPLSAIPPPDGAGTAVETSAVAASVSALEGAGDPALSVSIELPSLPPAAGAAGGGDAGGADAGATAFLIGVPEQANEYMLAPHPHSPDGAPSFP